MSIENWLSQKPPKSAHEELKKGLKSLRRNAVATAILTFINIAGAGFVLIISFRTIVEESPSEGIAAAVPICAILYGVFWFFRLYKAAKKPMAQRPGCIRAPAVITNTISEAVEPFIHEGCLTQKRIAFFVNQHKTIGGPNVQVTRSGNEIELPLSFLKLMTTDRAAALACLQHEIAHVVHGDAKAWAFASTFWHVLTRIGIPLRSLDIIMMIVLLALAQNQYERAIKDGEAAKAQIDTEYKEALAKLTQSSSGTPAEFDKAFLDFRRDAVKAQIDSRVQSADKRGDVVVLSIPGVFVGTGFLVWVLLSLRRDRWLAEKMADTEVIRIGNATSLMSGLEFLSKPKARATLFSLHPALKKRLKYINQDWDQRKSSRDRVVGAA